MKLQTLCHCVTIFAVSCFLQGCSGQTIVTSDTDFQHDIPGGPLPWTNERFDSADEKFTFAVFSDLTGGEREGVFEIAVAQLALLRPELIINVGDLVEGETDDVDVIDGQWDSFDERANRATAPIFYVGGNHDLLGVSLRGAWDRRYGPRYYHFVYKNTLFLVLDTEDHTPKREQEIVEARDRALEVAYTEGWDAFGQTEYVNMAESKAGTISEAQAQYFQRVIAANPDVRWTFVFMHKAAWKREDMQTFASIEEALRDRPYTVFNGHVHAYEHEVRHGRDYIRLATTGGVQLPANGRSMDHVALVTVSSGGVDIANLLMAGILDKTGHIPLGGDDVCFESTTCGDTE